MSFFTHQALFKQGQILADEFTHQAGIERHREAAALNLEERSDGQAGLEKEYVYYARLEDVKVLATATHVEHHEQWEIRIPKTDKNASAMRVRVRKTTDPKSPDSAPEYVETKKIKLSSKKTNTSNWPATTNCASNVPCPTPPPAPTWCAIF